MKSAKDRAKHTIRTVLDTAVWLPANLHIVSSSWFDRRKNQRAGFTDHDHLLAAADWLCSAQDVTSDGGVAGRYALKIGWSSSYPETTGYIIPTFLRLAEVENESAYRERAQRCVDFLLSVQLDSGAFPGLEIAHNRTEPSIFNTAQIVCGLRAWYSETQEQQALTALTRACDWLVEQQDSDGAWRKYAYNNITYTYMAHAACWLAEAGDHLNHQPYLNAAELHLQWVLQHVDSETGWVDKCGFTEQDHAARCAVTHTIAYTIWGVLLLSKLLKHDTGMQCARHAAHQVARRLELSHWLPGALDWRWRPQASYACLTGNAQMALIWFELNRLQTDLTLVSAACKAIDLIKQAQPMAVKNAAIRGGITGSDPVWGDYIYAQIPNWAAKFFIDALLDKQQTLANLELPEPAVPTLPTSIPSALPAIATSQQNKGNDLRVVFYTNPWSDRVQGLLKAWASWAFKPTAVIVSREPELSFGERLRRSIRDEGMHGLLRRVKREKTDFNDRQATSGLDHQTIDAFCQQHDIEVVEVGAINSDDAIAAIMQLQPDIAVNAGTGILRQGLLDIPKLETLNAHMGILPQYRGMNVAEWSRAAGDVVGCTVHLIDPGIDTGDILCARVIAIESVASVNELRRRVDEIQIQLLGEVLRYIGVTGKLPPRYVQDITEGKQYFVMHPAVHDWLDSTLKHNSEKSV